MEKNIQCSAAEKDSHAGTANENDEEVNFAEPWDGSDVVFVVQDRKVYANKLILSMSSPVFKRMFQGVFKEKDATEIPLPDKTYEGVLEFMNILHPPMGDEIFDNVYDIIALAEEYQTEELKKRCVNFLLQQPASIKTLVVAEVFQLEDLASKCINYAKKTPLFKLEKEEDFNLVKCSTLAKILHHKAKELEHSIRSICNDVRQQGDSESCCECTIFKDPLGNYIKCQKHRLVEDVKYHIPDSYT